MRTSPITSSLARLGLMVAIVSLVLGQSGRFALSQEQESPQQRGRGGLGGFGQGVIKARVTPHWFAGGTKFWYRNDLRDGAKEYIVVDAAAGSRGPAFDQAKVAAALVNATDKEYKADHLPFEKDTIEFVDDGKAIAFTVDGKKWKCNLTTYELTAAAENTSADGAHAADSRPQAAGRDEALAMDDSAAAPFDDEVSEGTYLSPQDKDTATPQATPQTQGAGQPQNVQQGARRGFRSGRGLGGGGFGAGRGGAPAGPAVSPDKKWTAVVHDSNVYLRDGDGTETQLSKDGKEDFAYTRLNWSPNSAYLVAFRTEPGDHKEVYRLQSSPPSDSGATGGGVGRAVLQQGVYALPGDKLDSFEVNVFDVASKQQYKPLGEDRIDMSPDGGDARVTFDGQGANFRWRNDGAHLLFEKYDRGHQRLRLVEVDAAKGETRNVIDEKSKTFIWSAHTESLGIRPITYLRNEKEILYVSEMDGWRHFYLIDIATGTAKQITKGQWIVRSVNRLDEDNRQIWFTASGIYPDQDPYFIHYGRVNFDGTGLTWLTSGNGSHSITFGGELPLGNRGAGAVAQDAAESSFSPDMKYVIDSYSRIDMPPVTELRRVDNGQIVCALEKAEVTVPWEAPEVFVAKGRDGETDIWGFISRPRNLDTSKKYAIIEDIYGGPQGSFVPKTFSTTPRYRDLTDLGFVVVKIDGMGTANRSKAFHDVCWHNLKDGGFLDRIAWIKAAAEKYPYLDIARVGIYGTSAGGQNACAAVLFHPEFYKVAVANSGCHDNRMDKVSWNEQWMGYPVGPQYSESSNIDNAGKLQGRLQLVVGELDTNVPPESTFRLVNALVQARKDFEFVMIPGANHGAGSPITQTKRNDFFIRYLQGTEPPNHNARIGVASD